MSSRSRIADVGRRNRVVDAAAGETRLAAELDRAARYGRSVTVALLQLEDDARADAIAGELRGMDLLAEDGDGYLLILPELGRVEGKAAVATLARGTPSATVLAPDDGTTLELLVGRLRAIGTQSRVADPSPEVTSERPVANMRGQLALIERNAIVAALDSNQGNQTRTALQLGLSRRALIYKMEKYGLKAAPNR